jgi:phosphopantothenoylcysteine decarboxylase/phosphopantothenate--cysteine ligase
MQKDPLSGKKILLGITGCIAAYKACYIIRDLKKRGAEVKVVMTPSATEFITPLTLASLSGNDVVVHTFPPSNKTGTALSTWHIAHGFADNALTTLVTALRAPLIIAPAADVDMYKNRITQENFKRLEFFGYYIIYAEEGELASGLVGEGRLADTNKIIDSVEIVLSGYSKDLTGKKILVSAGPTYEDFDPVRYLGNRSSGKMGFALAKAAFLRGAEVTLISGPSNEIYYPEINLIKVRTAQNMFTALKKELQKNDILIMAAAVADYKPARVSNKKIKKSDKLPVLKLVETTDILLSLNSKGKTVVGFALETNNELANAKKKLKEKNLDMIILNSLKEKGTGFEGDTNKVTILRKEGKAVKLPLQSKFQVANKILSEINKFKYHN